MDKIVQKKSRHNKLSLNLNKKKRFKNILRFTTARCFSQLRKEVATRSRSTRMLYQQCWTKMFLIFSRAKPILPNFQTHTKRRSCSPENRAGDTVDFYYLENWEGLDSFRRIRSQVWICAWSITFLFFMVFLAKSLVKKTSHRTKAWSVLEGSQTEDRRKVIPPSWN